MIFDGIVWQIVLFLLGVVSSIYLMNLFLRKILGVKKKKAFSTKPINEVHKKWERIMNVGLGIIIFCMSIAVIEYGPTVSLYVFGLTVGIGIAQVLLRAGFEKKHAENPNDYLYTVLEPLTTFVILITFGVSLFPDFMSVIFSL